MMRFNLVLLLLVSFGFSVVFSQQPKPNDGRRPPRQGDTDKRGQNGGGRGGNQGPFTFQTDVPVHPWDIVSGRPSRTSITLSVLAYRDIDGHIAYGTEKGKYPNQTAKQTFRKGEPLEIVLKDLKPNTRYYYQFRNTAEISPEYSFSTARPSNTDFTFAIQADSHLDEGVDTDTYKRSLANVAAANADFLIDLGDTFMCDKRDDYKESAANYLAQRYYFGLIAPSIPVFLTLGNHDGESGSKSREMLDWSNMMRRRYFPNPLPSDFYSGNRSNSQNYFAWEWGDAQFVVLDPFTYTTLRNRDGDNWNWTLGKEQYDWLKDTLEKSRSKYKFVFIHHLVGGGDKVARGGSEAAPFWEWGGKNFEGKYEFAEKRPGFALPIHQLFLKNGVSAVFHGHDHIFVKQDLDGIVYQEVPQPGHRQVDNVRNAEEYGYKTGIIKGSSGVLIVKVRSEKATVDYVRAFPSNSSRTTEKDGSVSCTYEVGATKRKQ